MTAQALHDFVYVGVFLLAAVLFAISPLIASWLIGGRSVGAKRAETYESGMPAIGSAWIQFSVAYYIYALIFLAFDVDVLYLFPVALAYDKGFFIRDFIEIVIFIGILSLAIVYAWRKGVFTWQKRR
ncbi:MAG: NADH-quinone oxidoreductase subunit A [Deltaproteobacteria bacterium]|jgi:NADH-quinone oxidoreductase subunit A|nr:NADH-quinone oxidoreductase subunit A [Deltaproteobacteria bacterium]PNV87467.1 MAG: NADH-quinone oxidoreductase subunit A [Desulfobacteraceae bacterium]MDH3773232.1 NADH-quinone oxidoreductase subunit A [Deltaproteobacteria bacterium]MDH3801323.1 NADH-quinone oxidoreductase subunit A [Deltaproteobacteria bacterium]MDH3850991.1 NADH-quinone oxidoreductase subunit A [Deltaproteobacteria bacterium]